MPQQQSQIKCEHCGEVHDEIYIRSKCHMAKPDVLYLQKHHMIKIQCSVCAKLMMKIDMKKPIQMEG